MNFDPSALLDPQWWLNLGQTALTHWYYITSALLGLMMTVRMLGGKTIEKCTGIVADICRSLRGEASVGTWKFGTVNEKVCPSVLVQDGTGYMVELDAKGSGHLTIPYRNNLSRKESRALAAAMEYALSKKMSLSPAPQADESEAVRQLSLMVQQAVDRALTNFVSAPAGYTNSPAQVTTGLTMSGAEASKMRAEWERLHNGPSAHAQAASVPAKKG